MFVLSIIRGVNPASMNVLAKKNKIGIDDRNLIKIIAHTVEATLIHRGNATGNTKQKSVNSPFPRYCNLVPLDLRCCSYDVGAIA